MLSLVASLGAQEMRSEESTPDILTPEGGTATPADAPAMTPDALDGAAGAMTLDGTEASIDDIVPPLDGAGDATAERGRYLVAVGSCGQCHTPRDRHGDLRMSEWLEGAPVPAATPQGYPQWAFRAPRIAGLPQHTDEEFVRLMTTGVNRDGAMTLPPMPEFRMTADDARAIASYLRAVGTR